MDELLTAFCHISHLISFLLPESKVEDVSATGLPLAWTTDSDKLEDIYIEFTSLEFLRQRESSYRKSITGGYAFSPRQLITGLLLGQVNDPEWSKENMLRYSLGELRTYFAIPGWTTKGPEVSSDR
ncbi:hypothetical protein KFU94_33280 [Chloroflexi bacterium TSY]|nr:hypothetical protein [Chloroflexi bacterium TSY]